MPWDSYTGRNSRDELNHHIRRKVIAGHKWIAGEVDDPITQSKQSIIYTEFSGFPGELSELRDALYNESIRINTQPFKENDGRIETTISISPLDIKAFTGKFPHIAHATQKAPFSREP